MSTLHIFRLCTSNQLSHDIVHLYFFQVSFKDSSCTSMHAFFFFSSHVHKLLPKGSSRPHPMQIMTNMFFHHQFVSITLNGIAHPISKHAISLVASFFACIWKLDWMLAFCKDFFNGASSLTKVPFHLGPHSEVPMHSLHPIHFCSSLKPHGLCYHRPDLKTHAKLQGDQACFSSLTQG